MRKLWKKALSWVTVVSGAALLQVGGCDLGNIFGGFGQ